MNIELKPMIDMLQIRIKEIDARMQVYEESHDIKAQYFLLSEKINLLLIISTILKESEVEK